MKNGIFVFILSVFSTAMTFAGTLMVTGEVGNSQVFGRVKASRCGPTADSCKEAVVFELNKAVELVAGDYMVGFEGSIYPGLVRIPNQGLVQLSLQKIPYPPELQNEPRVKVYRDFHHANGVEIRKKALEIFYAGGSFFRLARHSFGDLYLAGATQREIASRSQIRKSCQAGVTAASDKADLAEVCKNLSTLASTQKLIRLIDPSLKPDFIEVRMLLNDGFIVDVRHPRYLVAAPLLRQNLKNGGAFVSVFPGSYKFVADASSGKPLSVTTAGIPQGF